MSPCAKQAMPSTNALGLPVHCVRAWIPPSSLITFIRIFTLAAERDLDLDFHVDENGNARARGLRYIAQKAVQHGYQGRVVAGHCW